MVDRNRGHMERDSIPNHRRPGPRQQSSHQTPLAHGGVVHGTAIQWLQIPWDSKAQALDISCKELIPIILASATWGHKWAGHQVVCHCDNQVVIAALRSRSSRQPHLMHLLRCMAFAEASLNFNECHLY